MRAPRYIQAAAVFAAVAGLVCRAPAGSAPRMTAEDAYEMLRSKYSAPSMPVMAELKTTTTHSGIEMDDQVLGKVIDWRRDSLQRELDDMVAQGSPEIYLRGMRQQVDHVAEDIAAAFRESAGASWTRYLSDGQRWRRDSRTDGRFSSPTEGLDRTYEVTRMFDGDTSWTFRRAGDKRKRYDPDWHNLGWIEPEGNRAPRYTTYDLFVAPGWLTFAPSEVRPVELKPHAGSADSQLWDLVVEYPNFPDCTLVITIDARKEYAVTEIFTGGPDQNLRWVASNWQKRGGRWMPGAVEVTTTRGNSIADQFAKATGHAALPFQVTIRKMELLSFQADPVIPADAFVPRFAENTLIRDRRSPSDVFAYDSCPPYMTEAAVAGEEAINRLAFKALATSEGFEPLDFKAFLEKPPLDAATPIDFAAQDTADPVRDNRAISHPRRSAAKSPSPHAQAIFAAVLVAVLMASLAAIALLKRRVARKSR